MKKLIEAGAYLNEESHKSPLCVAAKYGHTDCVKELIQAGADLNARTVDGKGETPLMEAARNFSFDCVSTLLKAGAEVDTTYLAFLAMVTSFVPWKNSGIVHITHYQQI